MNTEFAERTRNAHFDGFVDQTLAAAEPTAIRAQRPSAALARSST